MTRRRAAGQWAQMLIDDRPDWFDPLMTYFFSEVIGNERPIHRRPGRPRACCAMPNFRR